MLLWEPNGTLKVNPGPLECVISLNLSRNLSGFAWTIKECFIGTRPKRGTMKTEAKPSPAPDSLLRALQHSPAGDEAQFQILAETTPAAVFVYQEKRIVFANAATEQLSGYTRQEIRNAGFLKSLMPELRRLARPIAMTEQRARYEVKFTTKNGSERWLDGTTGPLSYNGAPALPCVPMDITSRKETERKLSIQNAYLEKLFESAPQSIVIIDEKSIILRANRKF